MKHRLSSLISIFFVCLFLCGAILSVVAVLGIGFTQDDSDEVYLLSSTSPNGQITLSAFRTEPGATVDYSIKVYMIDEDERTIIYNAYHEDRVNIQWIDDTMVCINGIQLDLSKNETYDWRIG